VFNNLTTADSDMQPLTMWHNCWSHFIIIIRTDKLVPTSVAWHRIIYSIQQNVFWFFINRNDAKTEVKCAVALSTASIITTHVQNGVPFMATNWETSSPLITHLISSHWQWAAAAAVCCTPDDIICRSCSLFQMTQKSMFCSLLSFPCKLFTHQSVSSKTFKLLQI